MSVQPNKMSTFYDANFKAKGMFSRTQAEDQDRTFEFGSYRICSDEPAHACSLVRAFVALLK